MKRLNKEQAIAKFGKNIIAEVENTEVMATSRVMYPAFEDPSHLGKEEFVSEPVEADGYSITAYWYGEDIEDLDDNSIEFEVEKIW